MTKKIFLHGFGHKAASWNKTTSYMTDSKDILCPDLSLLLEGKETSYENLYSSFVTYCNKIDGQIHLCGLSLGGILALNFTLDFPQKVKSLVLIATPHKVQKGVLGFQNLIFRLLPKSIFEAMAFSKDDTFALVKNMKNLDFTDRVKNIKCPALILCGNKDSANLKSAEYLSQNIDNSQLKVIENTGHVVNEENPEALAEILTEFYSSAVQDSEPCGCSDASSH